MQLLTIGYAGFRARAFFELLVENRVQVLVDVRELPLSRKPGFSKSPLIAACEQYGLVYTHHQRLGCPKEIRYDYRDDDDWGRYRQRFLSYLETQAESLAGLAALAETQRSCLLCYEADPAFCHRSMVAEAAGRLMGAPATIVHLRNPESPGRVVWQPAWA